MSLCSVDGVIMINWYLGNIANLPLLCAAILHGGLSQSFALTAD
jgi:hypothetical protein